MSALTDIREGERGSAALGALALLILVAAFAAAAYLPLATGVRAAARAEGKAQARAKALDAVLAALPMFEEGAADGVDSRAELEALEASFAGALLVDDVSSRFNPNLLRKNFIEKTTLARFLKPGASVDALQQARVESGLSVDIATAYGDFFEAESLAVWFTPYTYASVNTDDEFALERLWFEATGDSSGAAAFREANRRQLEALTMLSPAEFAAWYGVEAEALAPFVGAEPVLNVNLAEMEVLEAALAYPGYGIESPHATAQSLTAAARSRALDRAALAALAGLDGEHPAWAWLGTRTWFWRIFAKSGDAWFRAIVRMEDREDGTPEAIVVEFREGGPEDDPLKRHD
ncbi:MAG TPA: hypothetical protein PKW82_10640 [Spirochaetales bacterium]|nr:hypothetical protein [Spirochaetales bacterium]